MRFKKTLEKYIKNMYFFSTCLLLASLPFSFYTTSISIFLLGTTWLISLPILPIKKQLKNNSEVFLFLLIIILHIVWFWNTKNTEYAFNDIQRKLALFAIPLIMASMPAFGRWKRNFILHFFVLVMFAAGISVILVKLGMLNKTISEARNYSIHISHIRLSLMIVLSIFISLYFISLTKINKRYKLIHTLSIIFSFYILFVLQAFTGLTIFALTFIFIFPSISNTIKSKAIRKAYKLLLFFVPTIILIAIGYTGYTLLHSNKPYTSDLSKKTKQGNSYIHNQRSVTLENGNLVYSFINHQELKQAWNSRSFYNYDSLDNKGHLVRSTLIRYLTSLGEYKDAEGVYNLSNSDIEAIENGVCNYRFKEGETSFSRLYYSLWQIYNYVHNGNPSGQSITQRLEYLKTGFRIYLREPIWGVGTGDLEDEFNLQYRLDNSPLLPEFRHRTHNQYLSFLITFGFFGFIIFLIAWFIPPNKKGAYKNYFFLTFFLIASFSMLSDDTFETLTGAAFVATFYSLFLWGFNQKSMFQEKFMRRAIELAKENIKSGNGPFGAVIVKDGEIVAETSNSVTMSNDPTAHAEVNAIRLACKNLDTFDLSGCEIYSSCEPCPMCLGAIYWAQLEKLYFASGRRDAADAGFSDEFIYEEFAKNIRERKIPTRQMLKDEADDVFKAWNDYEDKIRY